MGSANALKLESTLQPFSIPGRIFLVASVCVITLVILFTTESIDLTGKDIDMMAPLLAQVSLRIKREPKTE